MRCNGEEETICHYDGGNTEHSLCILYTVTDSQLPKDLKRVIVFGCLWHMPPLRLQCTPWPSVTSTAACMQRVSLPCLANTSYIQEYTKEIAAWIRWNTYRRLGSKQRTHSVGQLVDFSLLSFHLIKVPVGYLGGQVKAGRAFDYANSTYKRPQKSENKKGIMAWHILAF